MSRLTYTKVANMNLTETCHEGLQHHFLKEGECVQKLHSAMGLMQGSYRLQVVI
ncbi:hypothetical protein Hanom_Chr04g00383261 [Helianthus anomalus]